MTGSWYTLVKGLHHLNVLLVPLFSIISTTLYCISNLDILHSLNQLSTNFSCPDFYLICVYLKM